MLDRLALGDHVCWTLDDDAGRLDAIATVVRAGLNSRHRVLYCGDDPADVLAGVERRGVRIAAALTTGQLLAERPESCFLTGGHFDPDRTMDHWRTGVAQARHDGWRGIRVIGDMSWAARALPGVEHLPSYEARLNSLFAGGEVAGVCTYDRRLFDPMRLRHIAWSHPGLAGPDRPYDPDFALRIRRTVTPYGVRLAGEADMANHAALAAVMADVRAGMPAGGTATVDVSALRFADTAVARVLIEAAVGGPGTIRVVGCSASLTRLLTFHGADRVAGLALT